MNDFKSTFMKRNRPATISNIEIAEDIWGRYIEALNGKIVRIRSTHVKMDFVEFPKWLIKLHDKLFITVGMMFINRMPFLISVLRNIKFSTIQKMANIKKATLLGGIGTIIAQYRKGGFHIKILLLDQKFNAL